MDWDIIYHNLTKRNWIVLFVLSCTSYFLLDNKLTLGIITGGLASIINFNLLQHTIRRAFPSNAEVKRGKPILIAKSYFRLLGLGIAIYFLLKSGWINSIGLAVGLSTVVISIISFGISSALRSATGEAG